jgi:hypothetical protein
VNPVPVGITGHLLPAGYTYGTGPPGGKSLESETVRHGH